MAGSLYEISNELRSILNSAMENDGEISQEEFDKLTITEENFKEKIEDYCKAIALNKYDVDACKCEKKRINDGQQVKNNLIERLKSRLLDAVVEFGQPKESKNGTTYTIDAGTFKLFTKNLIKFVQNEYRVNLLKYCWLDYIKELYINGVLVQEQYENENDELLDVQGVLTAVNANAKAIFETDVENRTNPINLTEWVDFTIDDLKSLHFNFAFEVSAYHLITCAVPLAKAYSEDIGLANVTTEVQPIDTNTSTLGQNQTTMSLTIK